MLYSVLQGLRQRLERDCALGGHFAAGWKRDEEGAVVMKGVSPYAVK